MLYIITGAGRAGKAVRLLRLDDDAEMVFFEKSDIAYANHGLPYYITGIGTRIPPLAPSLFVVCNLANASKTA